MQPTTVQENRLTRESHVDDDEIDLRSLLERIWIHRVLIITGTLAIVAVAFVANEILAKYESYGFLKINNSILSGKFNQDKFNQDKFNQDKFNQDRFNQDRFNQDRFNSYRNKSIDPISFKLYQPVISDKSRYRSYVIETGGDRKDTTDFVEGLISLTPELLASQIKFVRSLTPKEAKDNIVNTEQATSAFIGVETKISGATPELAQARNKYFSEYLVDTLAYVDLTELIRNSVRSREIAVNTNSLDILKVKRRIESDVTRLRALRALTRSIPLDSSHVIEIDKGAQKVLSPVAQIVAAEGALIEARIELSRLERERQQIDLYHDYYKRAEGTLSTTVSGHRLMEKLVLLAENMFPNRSSLDDIRKDVAENISILLEEIRMQYLDPERRYLTPPTLPEKKTKKSPLLITLVAGAGGLFLMTCIALVIAWWRQSEEYESALPDNRN